MKITIIYEDNKRGNIIHNRYCTALERMAVFSEQVERISIYEHLTPDEISKFRSLIYKYDWITGILVEED